MTSISFVIPGVLIDDVNFFQFQFKLSDICDFLQKQPPVFCKKGDLKIFCKFLRKTPVLESVFNNVKETPTQMLSCEIFEIFKKTNFKEHL